MSDQHQTPPEGEPHDLAAPYALDAVDDLERARFEAHLSGCAACQAEVRDLREAAALLSAGMELAPPASLRHRVLEQVETQPRRPESPAAVLAVGGASRDEAQPAPAAAGRPRRGWWLAAAAAVVIGTGGYVATQVLQEPDPSARIVQAQDAREFDATTGEATVIASAEQGAALLRLPADLEPPPQGQVYQAWYVGGDGSARSAGLLTGDVVQEREVVLQGDLKGAAAVGLTLEPEGGSDQPTSEPFAVVPLG
ncbi:anti-sigma factor [Ornithinimicrobium pratense]|uniref:Regulator of SigK n=1 Tax=Ornithinimicrobium pratense TaxID=2593973 RepID=A0A5J6V800_9MICO|nr:anti-sigma factor [Ornithinimicrobium pratense]QFG69697.1 anti-sigma factor [Ornithinimicrobium pratense]